MSRFKSPPKNEFRKAKGDLIDYGENELTGGKADLIKAGYHAGKGAYEEAEEWIDSYEKKDGTRVSGHTRTVHRKTNSSGSLRTQKRNKRRK